jgi:iron complex transport system permease protein
MLSEVDIKNVVVSSRKRYIGMSNRFLLLLLFAVLMILIMISFLLGRYKISTGDVLTSLFSMITGSRTGLNDVTVSIINHIRFPRIMACVLVGASLSVSGVSYQGIFQNPMVSPDVLGASAGACFGAGLGILLSLPSIGIQLMSFVFGLLAVGMVYLVSRAIGQKENTTLVLVLAGMMIASLFSAFISILKYIADPYSKLPEITFWLMGSFSSVTGKDLTFILLPVAVCMTILMLIRWRLNVLVFGDEEASSLGVNTRRIRLLVIICATILTASVVSISGQIGWVGLVIPHFCRRIVGPDYKHLLPASFLIGAIFLLIVDNVARMAFPVEIPLGILTSIIGAPCFLLLLIRGKRGWN